MGPQPLVIRAIDAPRPRWGRRLRRLVLVLLLLAAAGAAAAWQVTPSGSDVQSRVAARAAALQVRQLSAGEVPDRVADAVVATEDQRVFTARAADPVGLAGQLVYDLRYGCECRVDPMLTGELVQGVYLGGEDLGAPPWERLEGALVTFRVEQTVDERVVLADELSLASFGDRLTGAPAASQTLFGKPLDQLDLAQSALLVAIRGAGAAADPRDQPDLARVRRGQVLQAMVTDGYVTPGAAAAAQAEPLLEASSASPASSTSSTSSAAAGAGQPPRSSGQAQARPSPTPQATGIRQP